jgi:hypothetical protein
MSDGASCASATIPGPLAGQIANCRQSGLWIDDAIEDLARLKV